MRYLILVSLVIFGGCTSTTPQKLDDDATLLDAPYVQLFEQVLKDSILDQGVEFAQATPKKPLSKVWKAYISHKDKKGFDMQAFVYKYFELPNLPSPTFELNRSLDVETFMKKFMDASVRRVDGLPNPHMCTNSTVPTYNYQLDYFSMLGLVAMGDLKIAKGMVDNYASLIDTYGYVPKSTLYYQKQSSNPPFFSLMVRLVAEADTSVRIEDYLPQLEKEYNFWMKDAQKLSIMESSSSRVVLMPHGEIMNRYWSGLESPRAEAYQFDKAMAAASSYDSASVYRNLRAVSESGWIHSSRWLGYTKDFGTLETSSLVPVDLNCLLYHLELTLAEAYQHVDEGETYERYAVAADYRKNAILKYCWIEEEGFFMDYSFVDQYQTGAFSLAGLYPLYFDIATSDQIFPIVDKLENEFMKEGGLTISLSETGHKWDAPNGIAGLEYMAITGLKKYDYAGLADDIVSRLLLMVDDYYLENGKTRLFYNVVQPSLPPVGIEGTPYNGDNTTHGVYLWLLHGNH